MAVTIQIRRDQALDWTAANPILAEGEMGLELDTGLRKIGDGVTVWTSLAYYDNQTSAPATDITYDNTTSGLTATDVQAALDEIDAQVDINTAAIALPPEQFAARKNLLINGDFSVWQRGTSFSGNLYTADRWYELAASSLQVAPPTGAVAPWAIQLTNYSQIRQGIELPSAGEAGVLQQGQNVTLSFRANFPLGKDITLQAWFADGAVAVTNQVQDQQNISIGTGTGAWERYTFTWAVSVSPLASNLTYGVVVRQAEGDATGSITELQLELGDTATDFEYRPIGEELALCQRYFWSGDFVGRGNGFRYAAANDVDLTAANVTFPVTMRVIPTAVLSTITYLNCTFNDLLLFKDNANLRVNKNGVTGVYRAAAGIVGDMLQADAEL